MIIYQIMIVEFIYLLQSMKSFLGREILTELPYSSIGKSNIEMEDIRLIVNEVYSIDWCSTTDENRVAQI